MKHAGDPEEIAALVALLVSRRGRYITGSTIHIDGGAARSLCLGSIPQLPGLPLMT